ncbi:MAG: hypothetical protein E7093_02000 [Bacteroidales bacterium]|nr:hypothetical protein [Bacteroidales bacterium]
MKRVFAILTLIFITFSSVTAQSKLDSIAYRAMQVGQVMQQERVYLHFDNTAYYLGETMWFKAYVSFGADNRPSTLSKVLYVELVAPEGYVVETKKYKINDDGSCHGEFELKPLMLSGYYEVRAYTRYMLNWDKSAIFSRVFPVFDKVNADNWDFKNMLDRRRGFSSNGKWISAELPEATLEFFPEGGNLVSGLESRVAYELRGENGLFGEEKITILENGKPLLETTPSHMGKGSFVITPKEGAKYRAEVTMTNGKEKQKRHKFNLPEAKKEGIVMSVKDDGGNITVDIRNNFSDNMELGFVLLHRGTMGYYKKFNTATGNRSFTFAKDSLREGVNRAVIFADSITPLAERHFFITHEALLQSDNRTVKLNVTANGSQPSDAMLSPHQKVTIKVSRDDGKPITGDSDLSLTVSDAIGKQTTSYSHNLYTYMLLGSELKGYIPDAAQYFDPDNANRHKQLDLVMLTHGWTSYDWSKLTRTAINDMQPIERGITIKGFFFMKHKNDNAGHYGEMELIPQDNILTRFDFSPNGNDVITTTFRTDSAGAFVLQTDDFYGTRVASLKPQTVMRQTGNIAYQFALDRYYSPGFRLYDYWENHLGKPMSKSRSDSIVKMNPFEFMLSSLEVTAKKKHEFNSRPPHSEMRFNYLDEWEYAQDITYVNMFKTFEDEVYNNVKTERIFEDEANRDAGDSISEVIENDEVLSLTLKKNPGSINTTKYIGNIRFSTEAAGTFPVDHDYDHILTANDVVLSAMKRHNYSWAYWVQLMVVLGEYSHDRTPEPDMEYLRGLPDADKMTNFKEIVIRSDENTRLQFENRSTHWEPLSRMLDNKVPIQKFYGGFLSQSYLYSGSGIDGSPDVRTFMQRINNEQNTGINYPINPNYVACLIPYTEEERTQGVVPEFAAPGSTMRYTSVQGYSESKKFYSPDYGSMKPQEKDYRRTLCWVPEVRIENGEAVVEFYNSSCCSNISVDVTGRDNDIMFSNDEVTRTRFIERAVQQRNIEKKEVKPEEEPMDSAALAACAYHHEKALIYYNQKRYKDALTMFVELAQYRYAPSIYYIGLCYLNGTGLTKNDEQAYKFISNAAERGEPRAMYDLAVMTEEGIGTAKNEALAHKYYESAATLDEPRALVEMAHRYLNGTMVGQDKAMAERLLKRAAELKYPQAQLEYGKFLIAEGRDGTAHIRAAAEAKHPEALLFMYEHEQKAGNHKQAYGYAKGLHLQKDHRGTKFMADCYLEGKGVSRDKSLAKDLYREAAAAGNEEAKEIMKKL